ncbi:MAG: YcxB family protein [Candidatus Heimdallarchaeota archaeon]|nr:YcxB family protein [Candidatus Heimdallarchaeota archaeon]
MELVKLSGKYTFDEYNQSLELSVKTGFWSQLIFKFLNFSFWGLMILLLLAMVMEGDWEKAFPLVLLILYIIYFGYVYIPQRKKKVFYENNQFSEPFDIILGKDSYEFINQYSHFNYKITDFVYWREDEHLILLFVSSNKVHIIPKRLFSSESDIARVRNIFLDNSLPEHDGLVKTQMIFAVLFLIILILPILLSK